MNDVVDIYDRLAKEYLSSMYTENSWTRYVDKVEKETILKFWKIKSGERGKQVVLDLGMGPGRWSKFFLELGFKKVYGVDIAPNMVKIAKKEIKNKNFHPSLADFKKLPFKQGMFDKMFCFRAFKYSSYPESSLKEVRRVLKPKGTFILEVSNKSLSNVLLKRVSALIVFLNPKLSLESRFRYFYRARFYSLKDIKILTGQAQFQIIQQKPLFVLPSIPLPLTKSSSVVVYKALDLLLSKILPSNLFARSWVFLIKK